MEVRLHDLCSKDESRLKYVVITALYKGKWICVRHRERITWELPGGHIEPGEVPIEAARRELYEETGATDFHIEEVCDYSVTAHNDSGSNVSFGRLYFSRIQTMGELPESEIEDVKVFEGLPDHMTYPAIQPVLFQKVNSIRMLADREI